MTPRQIYYVDGNAAEYSINFLNGAKITQEEGLNMIKILGDSNVIECWGQTLPNGHVQRMIMFDVYGDKWYASTVSDNENKLTSVRFHEWDPEASWDDMVERFQEAGLKLMYPLH